MFVVSVTIRLLYDEELQNNVWRSLVGNEVIVEYFRVKWRDQLLPLATVTLSVDAVAIGTV